MHIRPVLRQQRVEAGDLRGGQDHQDVEGGPVGDAGDPPRQLQAAKGHPEILIFTC